MNAAQRQILWTASLSHGLIHVYELAVPALLLLIQSEFSVGDLALGRVVTLYGLLFGLGALPAGLVADRLGSKRLLVLCLWGSAASVAGMAASRSLTGFAVSAACMGLCLSIYHPAGTALITQSLPLAGRTFALHGMAGNLGVACSTVVAGTLGALLGWRWGLGVLALCGVGLGLFVVLALPASGIVHVSGAARPVRPSSYALLLVAVGCTGVVYRGMTTFLPKFFATRYAADAATGTALGGMLTTLALLVGLAGMHVAGRLADGGRDASLLFLCGAVLQAPFLVALGYAHGAVLVPLAMALSFFHFFTQPSGNQMVADLTPPRLRGLGYGLYFFVSFGGGSLGATLGGWISERSALATTFPVLATALVPAVAAIVALRARGLREAQGPVLGTEGR